MQPTINDQRIRYFHETVITGSVRAAAANLDVSPSVISRQLKLLERDLSVALLERRGRNVVPTEAAQPVLEYYRQHVANQEGLIAHLDEIRGFERGRITIAAGEGFADDLIRQVLAEFMRQYPRLDIRLALVNVNEVIRQVEEDEAHLGLAVHAHYGPGVVSRARARKPVCAVMSAHHRYAGRRSPLSLEEILCCPLGLLPHGHGLRRTLQAIETTHRVQFEAALTANTLSSLKSYVSAAPDAITFLPRFCVAREITSGELVAQAIDNEIMNACENHLIQRVSRPLSPACQRLALLMTLHMEALRPE